MRRYETMVIVDPDVREGERLPLIEKLTGLIPQQGGLLVARDEWGSRKMAYPIGKRTRGYYLRLDYCGQGELVDELERFCRIDDRVMKYMTVQVAKEIDLVKIQEQIAAAAQQEAAPAAGTPSAPSAPEAAAPTALATPNDSAAAAATE
jgi:small subunit ribosomal protein S6